MDRLGRDNFSTLQMKGHVLHRARAHLKVPGCSNLSKRKDIFVKAADKGGALVVWRADLYQKEALRQLSDTSFYAKVEKDLTSTNQQIVKSTINDLIVKQELPVTATYLGIKTPRTSCIYFLPKIHKLNNPGRPIVSACSCPTKLISSYK